MGGCRGEGLRESGGEWIKWLEGWMDGGRGRRGRAGAEESQGGGGAGMESKNQRVSSAGGDADGGEGRPCMLMQQHCYVLVRCVRRSMKSSLFTSLHCTKGQSNTTLCICEYVDT